MTRARASAALCGLAAVLPACAEEGAFHYEGTPGVAVEASYSSWVPVVEGVASGSAGSFLVNTGSPTTYMDATTFAVNDGWYSIDLEALGLTFPRVAIYAFDVFPGGSGALDGLLGADILGHFALTVDYAAGKLWLDDGWDGTLPDGIDATAADPPVLAEARILGQDRFLVQVMIEARSEPIWAAVNTGTSAVELDEDLAAGLGDPERPRLDGVTVNTATGTREAYFTRVWSLRLAGADDASAELADVPVMVLPGDGVLDRLDDETGVDVEALIGGTWLRGFRATIDWQAPRLACARYRSEAHIPANEFVGVGFTITPSAAGWQVGDVYRNTDAEREGLLRGDELVELGGLAVAGADLAAIRTRLGGYGLGDEVPVSALRGDDVVTMDVAVEDLLPSYEAP